MVTIGAQAVRLAVRLVAMLVVRLEGEPLPFGAAWTVERHQREAAP